MVPVSAQERVQHINRPWIQLRKLWPQALPPLLLKEPSCTGKLFQGERKKGLDVSPALSLSQPRNSRWKMSLTATLSYVMWNKLGKLTDGWMVWNTLRKPSSYLGLPLPTQPSWRIMLILYVSNMWALRQVQIISEIPQIWPRIPPSRVLNWAWFLSLIYLS